MDSRRLAYLQALDIDVWERRSVGPRGNDLEQGGNDQGGGGSQNQSALGAPPAPSLQPPALATVPTAAPTDVSALDWASLEATVRSCTRCPLHTTRTQAVFGVGDRAAQWMVIGEAPGMEEDRQGEPFVGRAGQLLNAMLRAIGLGREQVFIANILKSRPPGNRDPQAEEVRACLPYLFRQIELVNPKVILCVGRIAAQTLLETTAPIGKLRGVVHRIATDRPMVVTYHPAYLLRSPGEKRKSWADLVLAMRTFEQLNGSARHER